jgi:hypothetical protein
MKPYDAKHHAKPWGRRYLVPQTASMDGVAQCVVGGAMLGLLATMALIVLAGIFAGLASVLPDVAGSHDLANDILSAGNSTVFSYALPPFCVLAVAFATWMSGGMHRQTDRDLVNTIRSRVITYGRQALANTPEYTHLFDALSEQNVILSGVGRPLLFRLDGVLRELVEATNHMGTSRTALAEAHELARQAYIRILAEEDASHAATAPLALERMRAGLDAIAPSESVDATAPSARIVHIVAMGEKALAIDPDLVDDAGMPIASLVRVHIPRFLRTHALARRTARPERVNEVDDNLDQAVETVRLSVRQALLRIGDDAADALAVELEFLRLRQRVDPMETAEIPADQAPIRALPDLTPENYVVDFVANGERSTARLEPWEREYQNAGVIEQAERMGYIHIGRDPRCSIEITDKGRSLVGHG